MEIMEFEETTLTKTISIHIRSYKCHMLDQFSIKAQNPPHYPILQNLTIAKKIAIVLQCHHKLLLLLLLLWGLNDLWARPIYLGGIQRPKPRWVWPELDRIAFGCCRGQFSPRQTQSSPSERRVKMV